MSNNKQDPVQRAAEAFKALSNPARLQIFQRLLGCCAPGTTCSIDGGVGLCVGEVGVGLGIAPSTLSHHVRELSRAGLIRLERRGRHVECCVEPQAVEALQGFLQPVRAVRASIRRRNRS